MTSMDHSAAFQLHTQQTEIQYVLQHIPPTTIIKISCHLCHCRIYEWS